MAISVIWGTKVIFVPQSYLTFISGVLYELDSDQFRLDLKSLEDNMIGMAFLDTHRHVTETILSGVVYSRVLEIINGYTVEFEDGQYTVQVVGSNHNIADVKVANQVSLIIGNSAGLVTVESPAANLAAIADAVWSEALPGAFAAGEAGGIVGTNLDVLVSTRAGHSNRVQMVWTDNASNNRIKFEAFLQIDDTFTIPGLAATLRMQLFNEDESLVYDVSNIPRDVNGIFRSFVPRGTYAPTQEQNLIARGTITDGLAIYSSAVGLSIPNVTT